MATDTNNCCLSKIQRTGGFWKSCFRCPKVHEFPKQNQRTLNQNKENPC